MWHQRECINGMEKMDFVELKKKFDSCNRIMCFGAGRIFKSFVGGELLEPLCGGKIDCVLDNDSNKWGTYTTSPSGRYKICNPGILLDYSGEEVIVLITCAEYEPIINQLKGINPDISYCIYREVLESYHVWRSKNIVLPKSFRVTATPEIPKVIHYCWFGKGKLPDEHHEWMKSWKKYCPEYKIVEWNESNYDVHKNRYISDAYNAKKWAFVSDYARLDVIYEHGGIYLDVDVELLQPLDELLYAKGFVGFELFDCVDTGSGFGAVKKLPVIGEMRSVYDSLTFLDYVDKADYMEKRRSGQMKLCTDYQTDVLKKHGLDPDSFKYQHVADLQVYPVPVLCGKVHSKIVATDSTYCIHHYAASWLK